MTDIDKLIAAVEAGEEPTSDMVYDAIRKSDGTVPLVVGVSVGLTFLSTFNGSLDAALALLEAVKPGHKWQVGRVIVGKAPYRATLFQQHNDDLFTISAEATTPSRALLLAILKAMKEEAPDAALAQESDDAKS